MRAPRLWPAASGTGWESLDHLDPLARHAVAVAGHDEPAERTDPMVLDRLAIVAAALPAPTTMVRPARRRRQMRRHAARRIRRRAERRL